MSTGTISDFASNELLDHLMGDGAYSSPAGVYLALDETATAIGDTGSTISEPALANWTNYAREQLASASFDASASRQKNYAADVDFGTASITGADVSINGWAICDSATRAAGNALWIGQFSSTITIQDTNPVKVTANNLDIKFGTSLNAVA